MRVWQYNTSITCQPAVWSNSTEVISERLSHPRRRWYMVPGRPRPRLCSQVYCPATNRGGERVMLSRAEEKSLLPAKTDKKWWSCLTDWYWLVLSWNGVMCYIFVALYLLLNLLYIFLQYICVMYYKICTFALIVIINVNIWEFNVNIWHVTKCFFKDWKFSS
jgi:hypothetical protein